MSKTIRWDDPSYATRSSSASSSRQGSDEQIGPNNDQLPIANAMGVLSTSNAPKASSIATTTSWRELTNREGRKYYYNTVTQKTVWEMPKEYREYLEFSRGAGSGSSAVGDEIFWTVLRERHVTSKFSWEEALRATINHPNYKCIPTLHERKASFARYCEALKANEAHEAEHARAAFKVMIESDPRINTKTTWQQFVQWHGDDPAFRAIDSTRERVELFDECLKDMQRSGRRRSQFAPLHEILKELRVELDGVNGKLPEWRKVKPQLEERAAVIPEMASLDLLKGFHEYIQILLADFEAKSKAQREEHLVREFKLRERFKALLRQLVSEGKITPFSTWQSIFKDHLDNHPDYCAFISVYLYGSTPLDLFYDVLMQVQDRYAADKQIILEHLKFTFSGNSKEELPSRLARRTKFVEELSSLQLQDRASVDHVHLEIYGPENQSNQATREQIDAYKHFLKHFSPPITLRDRWSSTRERLAGHAEFEALSEEIREAYFYKFLKWLDGRESKRSRSRSPPNRR